MANHYNHILVRFEEPGIAPSIKRYELPEEPYARALLLKALSMSPIVKDLGTVIQGHWSPINTEKTK